MAPSQPLKLAVACSVLIGALLSGPAGAATTEIVEINNRAFAPKALEITAGDTVVWTNFDDENHSVTFDDGSFDPNPGCDAQDQTLPGLPSDCMQPGESVSRRFDEEGGPYAYSCRLHSGMKGSVTVRSATSSSLGVGASTTSTTRPGVSSTLSSTTSTTRPRPTSTTALPVETPLPSLRSTTTTTGIRYTPVEQGEAPVFDPDREEGLVEVADQGGDAGGEGAAAAAGDGSGGGSSAPAVVAILIGVAGLGAAGMWKLRPRRG